MKRIVFAASALLAAAVFAAAPAEAQVGTARGKVVDDKDQPIKDAKVEIEYLGEVTRRYETKTNKKGEFIQVGVQPGNYRITVSKEGYQGSYIDHRISLGDPTYLPDFRLPSLARAAEAAAKKAEETLGPMFQKAYELSQAGKVDEAVATYHEILAKDPTIPEVHYNLGVIHSQKQDWTAAEAAYKKARELRPDYGDATVALAKVYQDSGRQDEAMALLSGGSEAGDAKVQFNLAVFHLNAGKYPEAEAAFKKVEALDPNYAEVQFHLATLALNQGKSDECVSRLEKYLSMSPTNEQNVQTAQGLLQALKPKK